MCVALPRDSYFPERLKLEDLSSIAQPNEVVCKKDSISYKMYGIITVIYYDNHATQVRFRPLLWIHFQVSIALTALPSPGCILTSLGCNRIHTRAGVIMHSGATFSPPGVSTRCDTEHHGFIMSPNKGLNTCCHWSQRARSIQT